MKAVLFGALFFVASCNAQSSTTLASTSSFTVSGCIGNCIGGDCPIGYTCDAVTQQCCLSSSTSPTSATCVDKIGPKGFSDCPQRAFLCNNTLYYTIMTDQCPKTCGRCGSNSSSTTTATTSSTSCIDKTKSDGTSDCPGLTRLCNNPAYYNLMTDQCPKTCGRCGGSTTVATTISVGRK